MKWVLIMGVLILIEMSIPSIYATSKIDNNLNSWDNIERIVWSPRQRIIWRIVG